MDSDLPSTTETGLVEDLFVRTSWILLKAAEKSYSSFQSIKHVYMVRL